MSYAKIRRLAKNYYKLDSLLYIIDNALLQDNHYINKLKDKGILTEARYLRKMLKYINIYKAIFIKSIGKMNIDDKIIVKEVYMNGKKVRKVSMETYYCEMTVYRILKKFDLTFFYDIIKVSRIIEPLCELISKM